MADYIKNIRTKVGHNPIILVFAGGILANDKNQILLQKQSDFNSWELPGGAIEFGETSINACKREFMEQTGLEVSIIKLLGISTNQFRTYPNGDQVQSVVITFLVKKKSGV